MKNKYKEELSKYKVSNNVKEKLQNKIETSKVKKFKLAYAIMIIILTCIISVGVTHANEIKEYIIRHSNTKYKVTFANGEVLTSDGNTKIFKTKLDDYRLTEEEIEDNDIKYVPLREIEDKLGMNFLSFNGDKEYKWKLGYDLIADKNHQETYGMIIGINLHSDYYVVDYNTTSKNIDARGAMLSTSFPTTNYLTIYPETEKDKEESFEEYEVYENYYGEVYLEKLGIKAYVTDVALIRPSEDVEYVIHFTYNDITYELWSVNLSIDEVIEIANNLS